MDALRWSQLSPLLDELLELEGALRVERLAQIAAEDSALADELLQLLAMEQQSTDFIAEPLLGRQEHPTRCGDRIGDYRLLELLGEGGMGQVWLAQDLRSPGGTQVALKLLRPDLADLHLRTRFLRERDTLLALSHARIPRLYGSGDEGQPYLALEYVSGESINDYCRRHAASVRHFVELFLQVCEALEHVHGQGIVHRDVKPTNILVDAYGEVRLLDFGIARRCGEPLDPAPGEDARAFTLHYAAPEQIRGEVPDTRADVYSLGVVLYELLTGQKPYRLRRQSDAEWERSVLRVEVTPPSALVERQAIAGAARRAASLRGDLDAIVLKAMQKDADRRYASVSELAFDLRHWQRGEPIAPAAVAIIPTWLRWWRRTPIPRAGA
ncbi:serine/threonine-protein kinase [Stenotrophomonas sp. HITSZ_GD]|uniref:serine/threonine-protein kinase n=1 Tax=Stenotrophomonas sp. HITSZ_GD TaxID=3037248 RepID=UPI00240D3A44|nr:serine/threonine-protein kinase [Stenotrophomonas sp. HITSZ_GD]MDG2525421.1 serine/threonine-protein kinase [Stenotrophomonas sp. HITSZ_GD]